MSPSRPVRRQLNVLGVVGLLAAVVGGFVAVPVGGAGRASAASLAGLVTFAEGNAGNCNGPTIKTFDATSGTVTSLRGGQKPVFSPDGRRIAFVDGVGLGVMNADGSGLAYYGSAVENWVQWSPDGTKLVTAGADGITIVPLNGAPPIAVTNNIGTPFISGPVPTGGTYSSQAISDINPTWSPTSDQVVFARSFITDRVNTNGAHFPPVSGVDLFSVHADGTGLQQLTGGPLWLDDGLQEQDEQPVFSPDGKSIAYRHYDATVGNYQIYVVGSGGGTAVNHTNRAQATNPHDASPSATWTPQNQLVWAYADTGAITVDGGAPIYTAPGGVCGLSWAGSGRPPTANFTWDGGGANSFNFVSTSTAASPATITGYSWDFGDGTTSTTGPNVTHGYSAEATSRTVTLTVTDSNGAQATSTQTMGPDLVVSDVTSTPPSPAPGQVAALAVTVRNDGPATVTGVLPTLTFTEPSVTVGSLPPPDPTLGPGDSTTFTVPYTASATGSIHAQVGATGMTGGSPVTATIVSRVLTVLGAVTATLTPSTTSPVEGGTFTLDLHVTNTSGEVQDLSPGVPTANPVAGVALTAPVGPLPALADGSSTDLIYSVVISQPGDEMLTTPLTATGRLTGAATNLTPAATVTAVPFSIVVNTAADDGLPPAAATANVCDVDPITPGNQCTLRAALQLANLQTGAASITFDIPGGVVPTIAPASALPAATVPVSIDATTQPGGWVELSGAGAGTGTVNGLDIEGGSSTIRGLVVNGWSGDGIHLGGGPGDVVAGNRIGTDETGTSAVANHIGVEANANGVTIGGTAGTTTTSCTGDCNLISGNSAGSQAAGVLVDLNQSATIIGNTIGTDITGTLPLGNTIGVLMNNDPGSPSSGVVVVGGPTATPGTSPGNLISGNAEGVFDREPSANSPVSGNLIGLDRSGSAAIPIAADLLPYGKSGISVAGDGVLVINSSGGPDPTVPPAGLSMTLGGPSTAYENVISGAPNGVRLLETDRGSVLVQHDEIGTDLSGNRAIGNEVGINSDYTSAPVTVDSSLISGNTDAGTAYTWTADRIGTNAAGTAAVPNGDGISGRVIGGPRPAGDTRCDGPCNLISGNVDSGIYAGNDVEGNFIGTDITGRSAIPNGTDPSANKSLNHDWTAAVNVDPGGGLAAVPVIIGGSSSATSRGICDQSCNLISGNAAVGVATVGSLPQSVSGNVIGRNIDGAPLGNGGPGVTGNGFSAGPSEPSHPITIGGSGPLGNVIADNRGPGYLDVGTASAAPSTVTIAVADINGNAITGNSDGINYPVFGTPAPPKAPHVLTASGSGGSVTVSGEVIDLVSRLATSARVDLYGDQSCEAGPQGAVPLGSVTVTSVLDPTWTVTLPASADLTAITATSTIDGQTSRFSACAGITSGSTAAQGDASYLAVAANGNVFDYGPGPQVGSHGRASVLPTYVGTAHLTPSGPPASRAPIVGMAATPDGGGYWLVASDGGVFAYGDAAFVGSMGDTTLAAPVVGIAATPDGKGYWLVASDGGVFAFGSAPYVGSMAGTRLVAPVVGVASSPSGRGYLLAASDGGVFAFGDATFHGSEGGRSLVAPVTGIAAAPNGGYWLTASDGGVFAFDCPYLGSMGARPLTAPVVGISATPDGGGYWLVGSDGGVFNFGDGTFSGAAVGSIGGIPVVGITRTYG